MAEIIHRNLQEKLLLTLAQEDTSLFSVDKAKRILQTGDSVVRSVLMNLAKKGRIQRIERGKYLFVSERRGPEHFEIENQWRMADQLVDKYYVGFYTAMHYWGMTEQIPRLIFIITNKRKKTIEYGYQDYIFFNMPEKRFFGEIKQTVNKNKSSTISSKEKTIIDGLTYIEHCVDIVEVFKGMWNIMDEVDWDVVYEMANRIGVNVVLKRLGYLLELLEIEEGITKAIKKQIKRYPYQYLDNRYPFKSNYSKDYGLVLNNTKDELFSWYGY